MARATVYRGLHCKVEFEMDYRGMAKCAVGPELRAAVHHVAEHVAMPYAMAISPRSPYQKIHFQDSFTVVDGTEFMFGMRRAASKLMNTAPHAAAVEWGNRRTGGRGHHVLSRTLDHLNTLGPQVPMPG